MPGIKLVVHIAWRLWPKMRPPILTGTVALLLFQVAGVVAMSRLRSYGESRGNVVKAIRGNSANGRWPGLIVLDQFSDEAWEGMATRHII
jgi:hypothetical protein